MTSDHPVQSGEAGHQGRDRQAGKNVGAAHQSPQPPDPAAPADTQARSRQAVAKPVPDLHSDHLHSGPDRADSEKSRGDIHHDQHEKQHELFDEFEDL